MDARRILAATTLALGTGETSGATPVSNGSVMLPTIRSPSEICRAAKSAARPAEGNHPHPKFQPLLLPRFVLASAIA